MSRSTTDRKASLHLSAANRITSIRFLKVIFVKCVSWFLVMAKHCLLVAIFLIIQSVDTSAMDYGPRPCGPDGLTGPLRHLIPQGVGGADFRPSCRNHDACYEIPGVSKSCCDKRLLSQMQNACRNSRRPIRCRIVARLMYFGTHRFGDDAFNTSQAIARAGGW